MLDSWGQKDHIGGILWGSKMVMEIILNWAIRGRGIPRFGRGYPVPSIIVYPVCKNLYFFLE